jgi:hypothetical protein
VVRHGKRATRPVWHRSGGDAAGGGRGRGHRWALRVRKRGRGSGGAGAAAGPLVGRFYRWLGFGFFFLFFFNPYIPKNIYIYLNISKKNHNNYTKNIYH